VLSQGRRQPLNGSLNPRQGLPQRRVRRNVHTIDPELMEPPMQEHPGGIAMRHRKQKERHSSLAPLSLAMHPVQGPSHLCSEREFGRQPVPRDTGTIV
jgi:hypothetical protein